MNDRIRLSAAVTLVLAFVLTACKGAGGGPPIDHPAGDALVLRVHNEGGFVPIEYIFTSAPSFTLLGDGRVFVPGAQIEIYPGPALPSLNVRRLSEAGIQAVLEEVLKSGLFAADAQYLGAQTYVADAQDTIFSLHTAGGDATIRVYALGIVSAGDSHPGISSAELAAHAALYTLNTRLMDLDSWLPDGSWAEAEWTAYRPDTLRLLVRNADAEQPDASGIPNTVVPWPTSEDPSAFGAPANGATGARCGVVAGTDAVTWYDTLSAANQLTRFTAGGHRYAVAVRFFLPDEPLECPPNTY